MPLHFSCNSRVETCTVSFSLEISLTQILSNYNPFKEYSLTCTYLFKAGFEIKKKKKTPNTFSNTY